MASHAKSRKENVDAYGARRKVLEDRIRADAAELGRVRQQHAAGAALIASRPQPLLLSASVLPIDPQSSQP